MLSVKIFYSAHPRDVRKEIRKMFKKELISVVEIWQKLFLPKHFQLGASPRYKYAKRKESYRRRKRKKKHHSKPLVYEGDLMRKALKKGKASGTSAGATLLFQVNSAYWFQQLDIWRGSMRDELTRTTRAEDQELANIVKLGMAGQIRSFRRPVTRRIA